MLGGYVAKTIPMSTIPSDPLVELTLGVSYKSLPRFKEGDNWGWGIWETDEEKERDSLPVSVNFSTLKSFRRTIQSRFFIVFKVLVNLCVLDMHLVEHTMYLVEVFRAVIA